MPSGRRERARDWLYEVGDNVEHILLSNSEEETNSELSELTSDFDTIEVLIEEADEAIDSEIEEVTQEVIEVVEKKAMRSGSSVGNSNTAVIQPRI
jgi:hypothetical protein